MTEDDIKAMQLESERDGKEGDEDIVQLTSSMSAGSFAMINGGLNPLTDTADDAVTDAGVEVKVEPKDPTEELMEKISQMLENPAHFVTKYQEMKTNISVLQSIAEPITASNKFVDMLTSDLEELKKKVEADQYL